MLGGVNGREVELSYSLLRNRETYYQSWSRAESLAVLKYRVGILKFRADFKYLAADGDISCRNDQCDANDTAVHAFQCPWNADKPVNKSPRELARFLVELNRVRITKSRCPIL